MMGSKGWVAIALLILVAQVVPSLAAEGSPKVEDVNVEPAAGQKPPEEPAPEKEPAEGEENAKDQPFFTAETLRDLSHINEFRNSKLWACQLLTACKLKREQVSQRLLPIATNIDDDHPK